MKILGLIVFLSNILATLNQQPQQLQPVYDLITRTTPSIASQFHLKYSSQQYSYKVYYDGQLNKIVLEASDNISLCKAYNTYLEQILHLQVSFTGNNLKLENQNKTELEKRQVVWIETDFEPIQQSRQLEYTYSMNICTWEYSFGFARWEQLQQHIDWSAMKGVNLILTIWGQEKIYLSVYQKLGLDQQQLDGVMQNYFVGVGYQAWNRMGNIQGWGGGIDQNTLDYQDQLQRNVTKIVRQLGMKTVLPAFNGYVPSQIKDQYPDANIQKSSRWQAQFDEKYVENYELDINDPLYTKIQRMFITELIEQYGTDHFYNGDQYNEMTPLQGDHQYLKQSGHNYMNNILAGDDQAIWIMQGWLFYCARQYWDNDRISSYLSGIDNQHLLILDLYSENHEMVTATDGYFGKSFIYNMLHDFGGRNGFYGRIQNIESDISRLKSQYQHQFKGIGITMEGIFQNYIIYDYMLETNWQQQIDLQQYLSQYIQSRYGTLNINLINYVNNIVKLVYSQESTAGIPENIIMARPNHNMGSANIDIYDNCQLLDTVIVPLFNEYENLKTKETYIYDLVDSVREYLGNVFKKQYRKVFMDGKQKYRMFDIMRFQNQMLRLIKDLDQLLSFNKQFMLGTWIDSAIKYNIAVGSDDESGTRKQQFITNAKQQVSRWGPVGTPINDYASKQWNGLVGDYYYQRWKVFLTQLVNQLMMGRFTVDSIDWKVIDVNLNNIEHYWPINNNRDNHYQVQETKDGLAALVNRIISQYKC